MNSKQQQNQNQQAQQAQQDQQAQQAPQGRQSSQPSQPNNPAYQPGQSDSQPSQSRQDDRFGNGNGNGNGGGQGMPGQGQGGQSQGGQGQGGQAQGGQAQGGPAQGQGGQTRGGQAQGQAREVANAASQEGGQSARNQPTVTLLPPVDIYEDDSGFTVVADLPGVSKEQLVVRVTGDSLLIEGSASVPATANMELVYGEVQSPQYRRTFTLSRELDPGKIEANLSNGVLRLRIPKAEEAKPRRIEVKVG